MISQAILIRGVEGSVDMKDVEGNKLDMEEYNTWRSKVERRCEDLRHMRALLSEQVSGEKIPSQFQKQDPSSTVSEHPGHPKRVRNAARF